MPSSPYRPTVLGRDADLRRLAEAAEASDWVSVLGPAGCGKSTLVSTWLTQTGVDAHVVDLQACADADSAQAAVRRAAESLRNDQWLLLDNAERYLDRCAQVLLQWRRSGQQRRVLLTSREALRVDGEHIVPLEGLAPDDGYRFILAQVRRHRPDWKPSATEQRTLEHLVKLYDGHPLALELAASRADLCNVDSIPAQQGLHRLPHPRRDAPSHHRSLSDAFAPSWRRLPELEQQLLARLTVCLGEFSLEDAQALVPEHSALDVEFSLRRCVQAHWLTVSSDKGGRSPKLRLYGTTKAVAAAYLEDPDAWRRRWYPHVVNTCWAQRDYLWVGDLTVLDSLRSSRHELHAIANTPECRSTELAARAVLLLDDIGRWGEPIERRVQRLTAADWMPAGYDHMRRARLADCWRVQGELGAAVEALEEALAVTERQGDDQEQLFILSRLVHTSLEAAAWDAARAYCKRGLALGHALGSPVALRFFVNQHTLGAGDGPSIDVLIESAKEAGHPAVEAKLLHNRVVATVHLFPESAEVDARTAIALIEPYGDSPQAHHALAGLATALEQQGKTEEGVACALDGLARARAARANRRIADFLLILASLTLGDNRLEEAERYLDEGEALAAPSPELMCQAAFLRAGLHLAQGRWSAAYERATAATELPSNTMPAYGVLTRALVGAAAGYLGRSSEMHTAQRQARAQAMALNSPHLLGQLDVLEGLAACGLALARTWSGLPEEPLTETREKVHAAPPTALRSYVRRRLEDAERLFESMNALAQTTLFVRLSDCAVRTTGGPEIGLGRRQVLWNVLWALLELPAAEPEEGLSAAALFERAWAGEYAEPVSAARRARTAIKELRDLGLSGVIGRNKAGYCIDPTWTVVRWEELLLAERSPSPLVPPG